MKQDLKNIGQQLKTRRTELNLSLKEAQNATSIQMQHLQALEDGQMEKLISPVYAQGFLKQYSKYLGIDGEKIVRDNPELFHTRSKQHFDYGIGTMELRGTPSGSVKWIPNALWILAFGGVLAAAYFAARYFEIL